MSVITRGIKNTFRNTLRTIGFSVIIAIGLGLACSMALAHQAVKENDKKLRGNIGASLLVLPIGAAESSAGLSGSDTDKLARLPHVRQLVKITTMAAQNPDEAEINKKIKQENDKRNKNSTSIDSGDATSLPKTSLHSAIGQDQLKTDPQAPFIPSIPAIIIEGSTANIDSKGNKIAPSQGRALDVRQPDAVMVGQALAQENKLAVGSSLTIKDRTFKVAGIFNSGTLVGDNRILAPFDTVRRLSGSADHGTPVVILMATSLEALDQLKRDTLTAMNNRVDAQILQQDAAQVARGLKSVANISLTTLCIALVAGGLTISLTMLLVVRERTKEISILKALGATNTKVVVQFMVEAATLTLMGAVIGLVLAIFASNSILGALLSGSIKSNTGASSGASAIFEQPVDLARQTTAQITTYIDWHIIVYGLAVALGIALVATILPAFLIAKVRPAQIMRGDA